MKVKYYESQYKSDNKLFVKKLVSAKSWKKAVKDPDMPKKPASAFFVFMEGFRQTYKENHPDNKFVTVAGRAGGAKWKSLSDEERAPYLAEAGKRKADYEKDMKAYNKRQCEGAKKDDYETSESEVPDDEDDNKEDDCEEDGDFNLDKDVPSLADEPLFEKTPNVAEAGKRKADYNKDMQTYNKKRCKDIKREDYEKSESEVPNDEDDNEEDNSEEDSDFETDKDVPNLADEPFLERGKTISSSQCEDSHIRKEGSSNIHATFSASSQRSADLTTDIRNAGVMAMTNKLLQSLKTDNLDEVEASVVSAYNVYDFIRNIGGDPSELQTLIDAYVRSLKVLFAVKSESLVDVYETEMSFQSAQSTYEEELRISKDLEKQLSEVTQKKVALETSLRALCEEETSLKERCRRQDDRTSMSKSSVSSLQQKMKFVKKLKKAQSNVDKCMEGLEAAML